MLTHRATRRIGAGQNGLGRYVAALAGLPGARAGRLLRALGPGAGILVLALAVRLAYLAADIQVPPQDTPDYDEIAVNLLAGEGFVARANWHGYALRSWRAPFYPFFLAAVYGVWGYSHAAVQWVQVLIGAFTAVLMYRLARLTVPRAAVLTGILVALYGPLAASAAEVMTEVWYTFWSMGSVLLLWPAATCAASGESRQPHTQPWRLIVGGIFLGLSALTRPVGLLLWPALVVSAWSNAGTRGLVRAAVVFAALACVLAPWSMRNYRVHRSFVPVATHGGFIVARSNADAPAWRQERGWGIEPSVFVETPCEVERDRLWLRQGMGWIRANPGAYLRLVTERFVRLWYFFRPAYNFWFMLMMPFAVAGLWRHGRKPEFRLIVSFVGFSVLVFSFVLYGSTRFRLPLEPLLLLLAATVIVDGWDRLGPRRLTLLLTAAVAFNLLILWQENSVRRVVLRLLEGGGMK